MYTLLELASKTFGELRKIGDDLNLSPKGDRRRRETWVNAIAGVNTPLLQLLETSPQDVQAQESPIIETVEPSPGVEVDPVPEAPLESKFGRIVYPRPAQEAIKVQAQEPIAKAVKTSPGVKVDPVQEPIEVQVQASFKIGDLVKSLTKRRGIKNKSLTGTVVSIHPSGGVSVTFFGGGTLDYSRSQLKDLIVQEPPITKVVNTLKFKSPEILDGIAWHFFYQSPEGLQEAFWPRIWDESEDIDFVEMIIRSFCENRILGCNFDNIFERFQRVLVEQEEIQAQELARNEKLQARKLEAQVQKRIEVQAQEPIAKAVKTSPGVEVDRVQKHQEDSVIRWQCEGDGKLSDGGAFWDCHACEGTGLLSQSLLEQKGDEVLQSYYGTTDARKAFEKARATAVNISPSVDVDPVSEAIIETLDVQKLWELDHANCPACGGIESLEAKWEARRSKEYGYGHWTISCGQCDSTCRCSMNDLPPCLRGDNFDAPREENGLRECLDCDEEGFIETFDGDIAECPRCEGSKWVKIAETEAQNSADDPDRPKCSICFDEGYVEDSTGIVKFCNCSPEPRLSRQSAQSAIGLAAQNFPGVKVEDCVYCTSPEYSSLRDKSYRCYRCEPDKSDQNPILTGICLSDSYLARYASPKAQQPLYKVADEFNVAADGQLSLLTEVVLEEPPDPDDFESIDAFREAIAIWDWEHPGPFDNFSDLPSSQGNDVSSEGNDVSSKGNDVSSEDKSLELTLASFCLWAPCPEEWYEPKAENLPLASSMIERGQSEVMEHSISGGSSITSDFFIPTFGAWCGLDRNDEPPDTGSCAYLPKPKPPNFPPQAASQSQVRLSQAKSEPPGTIPKLFHGTAGSSTQPARSPPGGDASFA